MNTSISPNHCIVVPPNLTGKILKVVTKDYNNMNTTSAYISSLTLIDGLSALSNDLSNYLDKRAGGEVSGDVGIVQHNFNVLSGNYIQTSTPENIHIYTQNGFVQAQKTKYGDVAIGSKGYCILSVLPATNQIIISGLTQYTSASSKNYYDEKTFASAFGTSRSYVLKQMLKNPSMTLENITLSDLIWSVSLFDDAFSHFGSITAVELSGDNTVFTFDSLPTFRYLAEKTIEDYKAEFINVNGDNALYVPGFPELGNQEVPQFFSQHVEGGSSKAIGKFSHAEGRDTLADSRYSHAEGTMTLAGGIASHAEGQENIANGRSSHSEGEHTQAIGRQTHAEGEGSTVYGDYSHAEGYQSKVGQNKPAGNSEGAHAEGYQTYADGDGAHSEGRETKANGTGAHAEGYKSEATNDGAHAEGGIASSLIKGGTASGKASHAEGYVTQAKSLASHSEGRESVANSNYSHVEGYNTKTGNTSGYEDGNGEGAHAEGSSSEANGKGAHAEGVSTKATGQGAHAEGVQSEAQSGYSHAEGWNTRANGEGAHAEGSGAKALKKYAHAEGYQSEANNIGSHAAGFKAKANADYSWCWNGLSSTSNYTATNEGSFCINPKDGAAGVFVGTQSLADLIAAGGSAELTNYLDKRTGGTVSGDVGVLGTFTGGDENSVANGKSTFAFGDAVSAIGDNSYVIGKNSIAGCYGWYYDHIDFDNNAFYLTLSQPATTYTSSLTGEGTVDTSFDSGLSVGDVISYVNKAKFDMELSVVAVDGNKITVQPFKNTSQYKLDESTPNHDDWSIFCPDKPIAGQIWFGEAAYAAGLDCKAINAYSHAEGKQNLAYGQYSHIEGYKNRGAYAAHAEGKGNYADGRYSHAEGWNTNALADCSHAEGNMTSALNECAHSEGYNTLASGKYSFAGGCQTSALGTNTIALGNKTHAEGYCAFACGDAVSALNSETFAIGWNNTATGQYAFVGGKNSTASGSQSIAYGNTASTNGGSAVSLGYRTVADADNTFCFGLDAKAKETGAFVWSGLYNASGTKYESHGDATFNINPKNGISSVYIGTDNFIACVLKAVQGMSNNQKAALKTALGI